MRRLIYPKIQGFTLIEVLVALSVFTLVMVVATGSVFSIVEANKKTHTLKSVMTNLNFALESMMREIRVGRQYSCSTNQGPLDCPSGGGTAFRFKSNRDINRDGVYNDSDQIIYKFNTSCSTGVACIEKEILGGPNPQGSVPITAAEITIESMKFYVLGSDTTDGKQPKVVITIKGYAGVGSSRSEFKIQTTVSQRAIDA